MQKNRKQVIDLIFLYIYISIYIKKDVVDSKCSQTNCSLDKYSGIMN